MLKDVIKGMCQVVCTVSDFIDESGIRDAIDIYDTYSGNGKKYYNPNNPCEYYQEELYFDYSTAELKKRLVKKTHNNMIWGNLK